MPHTKKVQTMLHVSHDSIKAPSKNTTMEEQPQERINIIVKRPFIFSQWLMVMNNVIVPQHHDKAKGNAEATVLCADMCISEVCDPPY
jgi:hypothetical protein